MTPRATRRRVEIDQIVGVKEIACRLGLKQERTVHAWARRYDDFPAPLVELESGPLWHWPEVEQWFYTRPSHQRHRVGLSAPPDMR